MIPRTVPIICAKAPRYIAYVPAVWERGDPVPSRLGFPVHLYELVWRCSFCGQRVKVVA